MPASTHTIEVYRPALVCKECGDELDRESFRCAYDEAHTGTELNEEGCHIEVEVTAIFSRVIPGRYSGPPEDCYPDEGGELDEFTATVDGKDFPLTSDEEEDAIDRCRADAEDDYDGPDPSDYYDDRW